MKITLIEEEEEEEVEVEVLMVVIDMMDKETNTRIIEANNQDMSHKENYRRLSWLKY